MGYDEATDFITTSCTLAASSRYSIALPSNQKSDYLLIWNQYNNKYQMLESNQNPK
jgi:hypothetical protein